MTITSTPSEISYQGNGVTVAFTIPFVFDTSADLKVLSTDELGNITTLTSGFSVTGGNGLTGTLTFTVAPAATVDITILDNPELKQSTDYVSNDPFPAESHERALDRLTRICKRLSKQISRALRTQDGDPITDLTLGTVDNRKGKYLFFNAVTGAIEYAVSLVTTTLSQSIIAQLLNPQTPAESNAGVTPTNYEHVPYYVPRYNALFNNLADITDEVEDAIDVAFQTVNGAQGNQLEMPQGTGIVSSQISLKNRVALVGRNKRGTIIKAASGHTGPYMFEVSNGGISSFDNPIKHCTLNCNDVAGLGGVVSDSWQEGGGLEHVLVYNFRTYGVRIRAGDGGATLVSLKNCEIFGSAVAAATAGVLVDQILLSGGFTLKIDNTSIVGGSGFNLARGVHMTNDSLVADVLHFEDCNTGVYLDGAGNHTLIDVTGGPNVTNVVEIAATFTGSLKMISCQRLGATNFLKDNRSGGLGTITGFDYPHLEIGPLPICAVGQHNSGGQFDGTQAVPPVTNCFNVASITKNGTGDYTITETRGRPSVQGAPWAITNLATNSTHVRTSLIGAATYQILVYVAGVLTDASEIKFGMLRVS